MHWLPRSLVRHGYVLPHWTDVAIIDTTPHSAMKLVSPRPRCRCLSDAVIFISRDMIDSFARAKVAIYRILFAYWACAASGQYLITLT
jgi:hypothetical protein